MRHGYVDRRGLESCTLENQRTKIMSFSPISDTLTLTKLAFDLYEKGYVVARDAPKQFRELLDDLFLLKDVLWHIQEYVIQDNAHCENPVEKILKRFSHTLNGFGDLVSKYEKLGEWLLVSLKG